MGIFSRTPAPPKPATPVVVAPRIEVTHNPRADVREAAAAAHAPRLTDKLLSKDLPELVRVAVDEIAYLDSRINATGTNAVNARLVDGFKARRESLQRSHHWLVGKIAAETGRRGGES